jgi:hypothetical protein
MVAQVDPAFRALGWQRVLRRYASYAFFEGRPATTRGRWINPVVFAGLRLLAALPGHPSPQAPIFIVGLGRSGTTILGMLLAAHRQVGYLNEPKALWHVVDPRQDINGNYSDSGGRFRLGAADADERTALRARRLFARYARIVGADRVVDKYPELVFRVPYVRALLPGARFVFIHRNGKDACQSIVQWSHKHAVEHARLREDWWGRGDLKWRLLWAQVVRTDPRYADLAALDPLAITETDRAAVEWITAMREGRQQVERFPDEVMQVSYESLIADPCQALIRLMRWAALQDDADVLAYAREVLHPAREKAAPRLHPVVQRHFDETMRLLGYGVDTP